MEERILKALSEFRLEVLDGFAAIDGRLDKLESKVDKLEERVGALETQVKENTQILKALEHQAQVNKAEHDVMMNDLAHLKGEVASIRLDLSNVEKVTSKNVYDITLLKMAK